VTNTIATRRSALRSGVLAINGLKAAIAIVFLVHPSAMDAWIGPTAQAHGGRVLLRSFGARDLALALGAMTARDVRARRCWLVAGAASDLVDSAATLAAARRARQELGPLSTLTAAWAAASGVSCLVLAAVVSE